MALSKKSLENEIRALKKFLLDGEDPEAEGAAEKAADKAQSTVGGAKDAIRDTFKK